nr:MnhB domain-containing protein [Halobaculum sp. XH14]
MEHEHRTTVIARTVVRVTVPIILVTALAFMLQGHNQPGGGFIGGVLTTTAFVLVYVVFGMEFLQSELLEMGSGGEATDRTIGLYRLLFTGGLAVAFLSGLVPMLFGLPFLTQAVLFLEGVPLYHELEVASALAFDVGVYLTVVGGLLTVLGEAGSE